MFSRVWDELEYVLPFYFFYACISRFRPAPAIILVPESIKYAPSGARNSPYSTERGSAHRGPYRSDNFVIEYIEGAPCWAELVRGVRAP